MTDTINSPAVTLEVREFIAEFLHASDRASVLIFGSFADSILEQILRRALRPVPSGSDDLFDGDKPLSTFSAKISMAFRLNLYDAQFASVLHTFRKTRNDFAHQISGCRLDVSPHRERVDEICRPIRNQPIFNANREQAASDKAGASQADFAAFALTTLIKLITLRESVKPFTETSPINYAGT